MASYNRNNPFETHTSSSRSSSSEIQTLKEAFPTIDVDIIEDVLTSVNGNVQEAFENLLHISDPSAHASNGGSTMKQLPPTPSPQVSQRKSGGCHSNSNRSSRCGSSRNQRISPLRRGCSDDNNPFLNGCRGNTRVRQDLAQWREQLAEESRQRKQNAKDHWRTSCSSARAMTPSFASSTGESRNYYNHGHNSGAGLGDALSHLVEAGRNAALSKANTALALAVNEANTALAKASDPTRSNTHIRGVGFSFNAPPQRSRSESNIHHYHATSTTTPTSASVRPTPPTPSSNSQQHTRNTLRPPVDRNRPLPTPPQNSTSTNTINPFDPMVSPNDELPPPSYEAHFQDRRVELHDDRIMQPTAQVSRST